MRFERLTLGITLALALAGADAAMYKWVDEKGVVQYSDKPPTSKSTGGVELSSRGVVKKKLDSALTPEQQKAKEEEEARRKAEEQQAMAQRRADNALLQSFTSVQEIDMKRDRELQSLEAVITNLRTQERSLAERLSEERKRAEAQAKWGKGAPASSADDVARTEGDLKAIRGDIERRQREMAATRDKYEALKKHYVELRQQATPTQTGTNPAGATAPGTPVSAKK